MLLLFLLEKEEEEEEEVVGSLWLYGIMFLRSWSVVADCEEGLLHTCRRLAVDSLVASLCRAFLCRCVLP